MHAIFNQKVVRVARYQAAVGRLAALRHDTTTTAPRDNMLMSSRQIAR